MKALMFMAAFLVLGACKNDVRVEDNGPDSWERQRAMRDCTANYFVEEATDWLRVACTFAIYGD